LSVLIAPRKAERGVAYLKETIIAADGEPSTAVPPLVSPLSAILSHTVLTSQGSPTWAEAGVRALLGGWRPARSAPPLCGRQSKCSAAPSEFRWSGSQSVGLGPHRIAASPGGCRRDRRTRTRDAWFPAAHRYRSSASRSWPPAPCAFLPDARRPGE